jgi:Flp pilus assembly protein TadG
MLRPFLRKRLGVHDSRGQALIETALTLPLLLLTMFGLVECGLLFNNWLMLTDAVRAGSRQLAISRGQGVDACALAVNMVHASASSLVAADISISWTVTRACNDLAEGADVTLTATYPCHLMIMGIDYVPGCTLRAQTTERVE